MKSNNKLTLLILSFLTLGVACSSSDDDDDITNYRISSQSEYTSDGNLSAIYRYYYNSDGSLAYRTNEEYNSSNRGQKTEDEYNRTIYEYSSGGLMTKELRYRLDSDGNLTSDYNNTYTYDSSSRRIEMLVSYSNEIYGDDYADDTHYWTYSGSATKPVYREIDYDTDNEIDNNTTYTYDDDTNNVVRGDIDLSDINGDLDAVDDYRQEYNYNSSNQYTDTIEYYLPKETQTSFYMYNSFYDTNGQITKVEIDRDDDDGVYDTTDIDEYRTYVYETGFCDVSAWSFFDELHTYWCL